MNNPSFIDQLLELLRNLYQALYQGLRAAQGPEGLTALFVVAGLAFAYGVFHVLLPGHQKAVISAYFISEKADYRQGFLVGALFALFHGLSAILLPLALRFGLQLTLGKTNQLTSHILQVTAFVGVIVIALVLLIQKVVRIPELRRHADLGRVRRLMGFDLHERLETSYEPVPWGKLMPFLFFAALLPCPDTIVFLAALSLGAVVPGLTAVLAMTLGMAMTLTILALVVIGAKRSGRGLTRRTTGWVGMFTLELLGVVALVAFAFLLIPWGAGLGALG